MSTKGQWYQCGLCNNLFLKAVEDAEALEEYLNTFPGDTGEVSVVCSSCYKEFMAWYRERIK